MTAWPSFHQHRVLRLFGSGMRRNQNVWTRKWPTSFRVSKGGSLEPWSPEISALEPGARSFYWLEPWTFSGCGARSPKKFGAEPGAQHFEIWAFDFPDCIDSWLLLFCLFLRLNWYKETEYEERTVHNTSICSYLKFIVISDNLFTDTMNTSL